MMVSKFLASVARPFSIYLELTVAEPCRSVSDSISDTRNHQGCPSVKGNSFSFIRYLQEQRRQVSPEIPSEVVYCHNLRDRYVRGTGLGGSPLLH